MIVCIAEKPSVARDIAQVLGATSRQQGYIEGNGYRVTWTFGHLCTLKEPHDYLPQWKRWTLSSLPIIPDRFGIKLLRDKGVAEQFDVIKSIVAEADLVINCGDAGQEGELIQRWVLQLAECKCPIKRLWLSSMTEEAIREAFATLKDAEVYQNLYYAGLSRAIGDWILGFNATRLYTLKYSRPSERVLSVGRVQTPTLALIVDRYEEIRDFVPQPYWEIKTLYRDVQFSSTKGRYLILQEAQDAMAEIAGTELTITDITKKAGRELPPRLFDLTSLQIECNRKFSYTADQTLKLIQSLYEKKLVTYPRVDTTYLTDDIYPKIPHILNQLRSFDPSMVEPLLGSKIPKSKRNFDNSKVTDHHAIIPTGYVPNSLSQEETSVFRSIFLRFCAAFYPEMKYEQTTVMAKAGSVEFKATGRVIKQQGWKSVYLSDPSDEEESQDEKKSLPTFTVGEHGPHTPGLQEKETTPPKNYTEATLLNAMETAGKLVEDEDLKDAMKQKGIGRPSTRAGIIETLLKRKYIRKERKSLVPTETGIDLIHTIHNELLKSVRLTGEWEYKLRLIDQGKYSATRFLDELKEMVAELVLEVKLDNEPLHRPTAPSSQGITSNTSASDEVPCPKCHKGVLLRGRTAYGCSRYREGCDFRIPFETLPADSDPAAIRSYLSISDL